VVEKDPGAGGPGPRVRAIGRTLNAAVARMPVLWPLLRPRVRRYFDDRARDWDRRTGAGSVSHLAPIAAAVLHVDPAPERILDVGTGTGEAALFLAREYPRASVRGVDISESMIKVAHDKVGLDPEGRIAFRVADASKLPFAAGSFDLVAQLNMPPFFAETGRILRPGGFAIVASSHGSATPFYTPDSVLDRGFHHRGIERVAAGEAGAGTYWIGRRPPE
jgi:ubiquinone/menaquinone biosynthesis C-methylase UbiE